MKSPERIREAIRQLTIARIGAERACAPPTAGVVMEYADDEGRRHAEQLRDENFQKVVILNRMIDALRWSIDEPAQLAEWMAAFEKMDAIEKIGFAARVA